MSSAPLKPPPRGLAIELRSFPRWHEDGGRCRRRDRCAAGPDREEPDLRRRLPGRVGLRGSGANQLDERKLAAAAGGAKCARIDADAVRVATGFPIGGVPPFGHLTHLDVFIDPDLLQYDEVWAVAGTWTHVFGIEPHKPLEASEGLVTDLKRSRLRASAATLATMSADKVTGSAPYFPSIEKKYGQPISHWKSLLAAMPEAKHSGDGRDAEVRPCDGHGHATAIVAHYRAEHGL